MTQLSITLLSILSIYLMHQAGGRASNRAQLRRGLLSLQACQQAISFQKENLCEYTQHMY